jgi:cell division protein FtsZ
MQLPGRAMLAIGQGRGEAKAAEAVKQALQMPLLETGSLQSAAGILVHFTGGDDLALYETSTAVQAITSAAPNAEIVFGATVDKLMTGRAQVILVATGLEAPTVPAPVPARVVTIAQSTPQSPALQPQPAGQLAEALFTRALKTPVDEPAIEPVLAPSGASGMPGTGPLSNLDVPAFLRRRRTLREMERGA